MVIKMREFKPSIYFALKLLKYGIPGYSKGQRKLIYFVNHPIRLREAIIKLRNKLEKLEEEYKKIEDIKPVLNGTEVILQYDWSAVEERGQIKQKIEKVQKKLEELEYTLSKVQAIHKIWSGDQIFQLGTRKVKFRKLRKTRGIIIAEIDGIKLPIFGEKVDGKTWNWEYQRLMSLSPP